MVEPVWIFRSGISTLRFLTKSAEVPYRRSWSPEPYPDPGKLGMLESHFLESALEDQCQTAFYVPCPRLAEMGLPGERPRAGAKGPQGHALLSP